MANSTTQILDGGHSLSDTVGKAGSRHLASCSSLCDLSTIIVFCHQAAVRHVKLLLMVDLPRHLQGQPAFRSVPSWRYFSISSMATSVGQLWIFRPFFRNPLTKFGATCYDLPVLKAISPRLCHRERFLGGNAAAFHGAVK